MVVDHGLLGVVTQGGIVNQLPFSLGYGYTLQGGVLFAPPEQLVDRQLSEETAFVETEPGVFALPCGYFDKFYKREYSKRAYYRGKGVIDKVTQYDLSGGIMYGQGIDYSYGGNPLIYFCIDLPNRVIYKTQSKKAWLHQLKAYVPVSRLEKMASDNH